MFSQEFILILERWIVIPLVTYLVAQGFIPKEHRDSAVQIVDQITAVSFMVIAYLATHKRASTTTTTVESGMEQQQALGLWNKLQGFIFTPTTKTTTTTTELPPVTSPQQLP